MRRLTVGSYLIAGFALVAFAVIGLVLVTAQSTYRRERNRTFDLLALAADAGATTADPVNAETLSFLHDLADTPDLQAMDPIRCRAALAPLISVADNAHVHVVDPDGAEVCAVRNKAAGLQPLLVGPWFERVRAGEVVVEPPAHDPIGRQPGLRLAVPITSASGGTGAVVVVLYTGKPAVAAPALLPEETVLVVLDPSRKLVLNRSANAPVELGASTRGTPFAKAPERGTVHDVDGRTRYYVEAPVGDTGWHVLAGLDTSVALREAGQELRRSLLLGGLALVVIGGLGMVIHRRLARPVRRLGAAIESSWVGGVVTLAPTGGPREVARVAEVFNELIVERATREDDLRYRATHDPLTGLRNRDGIAEALEAATHGGAVLYIDLDRFKLVNDSHGHTVGDRVLELLAARLVRAAGPSAVVARFGGDEFLVVLVDECDHRQVTALAERLCGELATPIDLDELRLFIRGSVGIARGRPGVSAEELVRDADTAMYRAKASGTGWAVYDDDMGATVRRRLELESALHGALDGHQLEVHYQPIVRLDTGAVVGAEALLRWEHPVLGRVPPVDFISVAEETGLIVPIGAWVLDQAVAAAASWAAFAQPIPISVNVAAMQFMSDDLAFRVAAALQRHELPPELLVLEVTETTMINTSEAMPVLSELRGMGVGVAIDDFGTGYSSLSYLERMPATEMKIDRSFVSRLGGDDASRTIVGALVRLARDLGLATVAEGVETQTQADALVLESCTLAQGFLYSAAMPIAEFERYSFSGSTRSHRSPQSSQR